MTFLKLLLSSGLIFMATMARSSTKTSDNTSLDYIDHRLLSSIVPIHYNIMLKPLFNIYDYIYYKSGNHKILDLLEKHEIRVRKALKDNKTDYRFYFYGQSNISIYILNTTRQLVLHSLNLHIDEEETILTTKQDTVYKPFRHLYGNDVVALTFTKELKSGYYNLTMKFVGVSDNKGILKMPYKDVSGNDKLLIITHLQPIAARRVFPCWDEPTLRATFNISIKHSSLYVALSNMPQIMSENVTELEDDMIQTHFQTTRSIPTYLIAFTLINMPHDIDTITEIKNAWWSRTWDQLYYAKIVAGRIMIFLNDYWKKYIKFSKLDHIVVPDAQTEPVSLNNIMDNWGMIVYRESDIIENESNSVITNIRIERFIAHKMTRHLLSGLVSPSRWLHVWLNDALAHIFGMNAISQIFPEHRIMDLFVVQDLQESLRLDYEDIMIPLVMRNTEVYNFSEIENIFSSTRYAFTLRYKGPALIFMLQHIVGHEILQDGIRRYFDKYSFHSATPDDLWDEIQTIINTSDIKNKYKYLRLKSIMNSWINKTGYPIVNVSLSSYGSITIEGMHRSTAARLQDMWHIPLTFTTQININFNDTLPEIWMKHLHLPSLDNEADWIIINLQQAGYYRVNYYSDNWWKIAKFLNSDDYTKIHILNRAQIIDDAYHFLTLGKLELPIFLELTKYLSQETDYVAWYPMFRIFEFISNIIPFNRKYTIIKVHMRNILHGLLNKIGYDKQSGEDILTKYLKEEAQKWAYVFGDSQCMKHTAIILKSYLEDYEQETHLPLSQYNAWINHKSLLKTSMGPEDIIISYIEYLVTVNVHFMEQMENGSWTNETERQQNIINILYITKHVRNRRVFEYLVGHFHRLVKQPNLITIKEEIAILITFINHVYDKAQIDMISNMLLKLLPNEKLIWMFQEKILSRIFDYITIWDNTKYLQYSQ